MFYDVELLLSLLSFCTTIKMKSVPRVMWISPILERIRMKVMSFEGSRSLTTLRAMKSSGFRLETNTKVRL